MKLHQTKILLVALLLAGCTAEEGASPETAVYEQAWQSAVVTATVQEKWQRSCALCHVRGEGGAPRMGDIEAWGVRLQQGPAVLLENTLAGLNRMPPLGYCMDCEVEDFAAMIRMMAGDGRALSEEKKRALSDEKSPQRARR